MNDHEEMRFIFNAARDKFISSTVVKDACGVERFEKVRETYLQHYDYFDETYALDVYIFCLSEHDHDDFDGTLSMWRAYARNGNGGAIIFDLNKLEEEVPDTPLYVAKVRYRSTPERLEWIDRIIDRWSEHVRANTLDQEQLSLAVFYVFRIFTVLALTTKHKGFREEAEWRVIYFPSEEDNELMKDFFTYKITDRGVEPKLRLPIGPLAGVTGSEISLEKITDRIILGPSVSSFLARSSFVKMLHQRGLSPLAKRVHSSAIPFRPT